MKVAVMASTGDDDYINPDEKGDLEYRERQLRQMQDEVLDLEDVDGGVSITDLGLNEFRMDLVGYHRDNPDIERTPTGINAVVEGDEPGILFVLRNTNKGREGHGPQPDPPVLSCACRRRRKDPARASECQGLPRRDAQAVQRQGYI